MREEVEFDKYLEYSRESPSGLQWKVSLFAANNQNRQLTFIGKPAGCKQKHYWRVGLNGKQYSVHRIIYSILNNIKYSDIGYIDHIDGNGFNNDISNLRECTVSQNNRNKKKGRNNTSGTTGVKYNPTIRNGNVWEYWTAFWEEDGVQKTKTFSVNKYGNEGARNAACEYRKKMIELRNNVGDGYSTRHGEELDF